ncbi:MAG: hypothetical protein ACLUFU_00935 [Bacilli bacterium]
MKKKIIISFIGILVIGIGITLYCIFNKKDDNNLIKIRVADATLTSMFYTTSFNQCIIELKQTKSMNLEKQPVLI